MMLHQNHAARVAAGFAFLVSYLKSSLKSMIETAPTTQEESLAPE
jgi:hypothetical protein